MGAVVWEQLLQLPLKLPALAWEGLDVVKGGESVLSCPAWHLQKNYFLTVWNPMFLCMTQGPLLSPLQVLRLCWQVFHVAKGRVQPWEPAVQTLPGLLSCSRSGAFNMEIKFHCSASPTSLTAQPAQCPVVLLFYLLQMGRWLGV